eukprot:6220684-Amphidinium_carterae.1
MKLDTNRIPLVDCTPQLRREIRAQFLQGFQVLVWVVTPLSRRPPETWLKTSTQIVQLNWNVYQKLTGRKRQFTLDTQNQTTNRESILYVEMVLYFCPK